MVFYFKSRCGQYTIYMGKDKYENEDLIKYGLPEDVWFHVDDLSSAHVSMIIVFFFIQLVASFIYPYLESSVLLHKFKVLINSICRFI